LSGRLPVPVALRAPAASEKRHAKSLTFEVGLTTKYLHTSNRVELESNLETA
jgi:hypothetical protein